MDFELTGRQKQIRLAVREFAEAELAPIGKEAADTANIYFNNLRAPKKNLVGVQGNGFIQLMNFLDYSRVIIAAHALGLGQGAMEQAINVTIARLNCSDFMKERRRFGNSSLVYESSA